MSDVIDCCRCSAEAYTDPPAPLLALAAPGRASHAGPETAGDRGSWSRSFSSGLPWTHMHLI